MAETLGPEQWEFEPQMRQPEVLDTCGGLHLEHGKDEEGNDYYRADLVKSAQEKSPVAIWWAEKARQIEEVNRERVDKVKPQDVLNAFSEKIFKTHERMGVRRLVEKASEDEDAEKLLIKIFDNNFTAVENAVRQKPKIELYGLNISPEIRSQIQKLG